MLRRIQLLKPMFFFKRYALSLIYYIKWICTNTIKNSFTAKNVYCHCYNYYMYTCNQIHWTNENSAKLNYSSLKNTNILIIIDYVYVFWHFL